MAVLQNDLRDGAGPDLGRRRLLQFSAAAGGTLLLPHGAAAQTREPRKGGTLRVAFPDAPRTLDPQASVSFTEQQYSRLLFDSLTALDAASQPVPALATAWRAENDATEWVFDLRQGVRFHHGRELTSADVVATIERAQDRSLALTAFGYFGPVRTVIAENPHRVRIVLTRAFAELPVQLAHNMARIVPADRLDTLKTEPVGTGPFVFKEFLPGSSLTVARNEHYWVPGRPYLDGFRMVLIREAIAQQAALRSGSVDLITRAPIEAALVLRNVPGLRVYSAPTGDHHALITQANLSPFDNAKVREAFKFILDRKALIPSVLFGQGVVGNDVPLPPDNMFLPELPSHEQDLDRAKRLIAESDVGPIALELYTSSERPPAPKLAVAFAEAASRIGVKITIRDVPYTEYVANVSRKKPFYTSQWIASATLYDSLYLKYHSTASYNYSKLEQAPGLDALLEQMISEVDMEKRKAIVATAVARIQQSSERIIPYFLNYIGASTNKLQGFKPPSYGPFDVADLWLDA